MARSGLAWIPLVLTGGAIVLLLFVVLGGINDSTPLRQTYFIAIDSKNASSSGSAHYTLWGLCGSDTDGNNVNCTSPSPAYPFDPSTTFSGSIPSSISSQANFFYYMSRFAFAFYLIALTFAAITLVTGCLALCSRLGGAISSVFGFLALFFAVAAAALSTAWVVTARNILNNLNIPASIGVKAMGFSWGAVGALFLASIFYCAVACGGRSKEDKTEFAATPTSTKTRFWQRKEKAPFDSENTANGSY